jgi:hypothetical protein
MMVVESPTEKTTPLEEAPNHAHDCSWRLVTICVLPQFFFISCADKVSFGVFHQDFSGEPHPTVYWSSHSPRLVIIFRRRSVGKGHSVISHSRLY